MLAQAEINRCEKAGQTKSFGPLSSETQCVKRAGRKEREEKQLRIQRPKHTRVLHGARESGTHQHGWKEHKQQAGIKLRGKRRTAPGLSPAPGRLPGTPYL